MRLGFSVAAHIQSDVLLLDEVFAVGDEQFQRKCFGKIAEFKNRGGTIIFVSHDAQAVERLCDRAVLLRQGEVAFDGETREAIAPTGACSRPTPTPTSSRPGCASGAAARPASSRRSSSTTTATSARSSRAGEPATVRLAVAAEPRRRRPARLDRAARRRRARARGVARDRASSAGRAAPASGSSGSSSTACRSPTAASTSASRSSTATRAAAAHARRRPPVLRLPRRRRDRRRAPRRDWSLQEIGDATPIRARELPRLPRLAAADGDRARAPVPSLHPRARCSSRRTRSSSSRLSTRRRRDLLRPRRARLQPRAHRPADRRGLRGTHWIDVRESPLPGSNSASGQAAAHCRASAPR